MASVQNVREAIVLAGGRGERLKAAVRNIPKPMAPIAERPFLSYLFDFLIHEGITSAVLAVGYKNKVISSYYGKRYRTLHLKYSVENSPLGTGGAIRKAMGLTKARNILVCNGDTIFFPSIGSLLRVHAKNRAAVTIAAKHLGDTARYGRLVIRNGIVVAFHEKKAGGKGHINGGIYLIRRSFAKNAFPGTGSFSFEDVLASNVSRSVIAAISSRAVFLDIGIPSDYRKAGGVLQKSRIRLYPRDQLA